MFPSHGEGHTSSLFVPVKLMGSGVVSIICLMQLPAAFHLMILATVGNNCLRSSISLEVKNRVLNTFISIFI